MTKTRLAIIGLLSAASVLGVTVGAQAQIAASAAPAARPDRPDRARNIDPAAMKARMEARHAERSQALKDILAITPAQEGAWNAYQAAMKPPVRADGQRGPGRPDRAEMEKLTTPQRLDRQLQQANERHAAMTARINATKVFYAQLSPTQKKAFDALPQLRRDHGGRGGRGGPGMERRGGRGDHQMGPRGGRGGEGRGPGGPRGERPGGPAA